MSDFRNYLRAELVNEIFSKAFLSGKHSRFFALFIVTSFGVTWLLKKLLFGMCRLILFPFNTSSQKNFRALGEIKNLARKSGRTTEMKKNAFWLNDKWHSLFIGNEHNRSHVRGVLIFVHAQSGKIRLFLHSDSPELVELNWFTLRQIAGISENCDLTSPHLREIYQKIEVNLL